MKLEIEVCEAVLEIGFVWRILRVNCLLDGWWIIFGKLSCQIATFLIISPLLSLIDFGSKGRSEIFG